MLQRPLSAGQKLFALSALELSPRMTLDLKLLEQPTPNLYNCLLVLNNRFTASDLSLLVKQSEHVVLSDGGANRLYDSSERDCNKVKAIVGDLDSIR